MGSPLIEKNRLADEGPERSVKVDSFWMAKYETTWDLFNLFVSRSLDVSQPIFNEESEVSKEESEKQKKYQAFFNKALKKFGVSSPSELEGDKKKEFFDYVDANYEADKEED